MLYWFADQFEVLQGDVVNCFHYEVRGSFYALLP